MRELFWIYLGLLALVLSIAVFTRIANNGAPFVIEQYRSAPCPEVVTPPTPEPSNNITSSWYGQWHHGRTMANGEPFDMYANTVAHKELDLGTKVMVQHNGQSVLATVTDRGPYIEGRELDVSYEVARQLGFLVDGVAEVELTVIGD